MKKILFAFPIVTLLAVGCSSSKQASIPAPVAQNIQSSAIHKPTPIPTTASLNVRGSVQQPIPTPSQNQTTEGSNNCKNDDMACLIAAASKCQPTSAVISYSLPNLFLPQLTESGQNKYEIKSSSDINNCILLTTVLSYSVTVSDSDRQTLLAGGSGSGTTKLPPMTDAQIDAIVKQGNDANQKNLNVPVACTGSMSAITSYLTDVQNHTKGQNMLTIIGMLSTGTMTDKTSSGQKLVCTLASSTTTK